ncbi:restriction endonuclease subunit S [Eubacterium sp.]|uniref:restriction endonuclease subunit S n=1 Tax=Eubacterium sp. TaxID=142586 RepID=UPI003994FFD6
MVALKDIATSIYRGAGIKRDQVTEDGIPCVRYGEIYTTYNTWFDECVSHTKEEYVSRPKYFEHGDILFAITGESVEDIAKSIAYIGYDKCLAGGDIVVMKHQQNPRYLAHVLNTTMAREQKSKGKVKSKVVHSNVPSIEQIKIPLPSLEVQERYADVLDNFEQICNDLNIGLPAELEARQKQYEYYRDLLLTFAETNGSLLTDRQTDRQSIIKLLQYVFGYALVKLDEIATITRGGNFQKKDFVENGKPCIHYGQMYTHFGIFADKTLTFVNDEVFAKSKIAKTGDIVMAVTSENVEDVCSCTAWIGDEDIAISGHTAIISHSQNAKYLSYFFHSEMFFSQKKKLAHGTKVIEVTPSKLGKIEIMLPQIEEQNRIVSILDRFDSLCNDITIGLPAEIEARKKQYQYYRDKLLSFE